MKPAFVYVAAIHGRSDIGIGGQQIEHLIKNGLLSVKYDGFKFFYEDA